jgi:DNA polymerase IV (DinB-like DNA polymerase)
VTLIVHFEDFSTYTHSKTVLSGLHISFDLRTVLQLLSEFIGRQKFRLIGIAVSRLREKDERRMLITDF